MRTVGIALAFILACPAAGAEPYQVKLSVEFPPGGSGTTVGLEESEGRPVVPVSINGREGYRFVLDSGASLSAIDTSLAEALGLPHAGGDAPEVTDTLGRSRSLPLVEAETLSIGGVTFESMRLVTADMPPELRDGIIGCDVLSGVRISLDPKRRSAVLRPPGTRPKMQGRPLDVLRDSSGLPYITGRVDGTPVRLLLDTGSRCALALTPADASACSIRLGDGTGYYCAVRGGFAHEIQPVRPVSVLDIGGVKATGLYARIGGRRSLVGSAVLSQVKLGFDLPGGKVYIAPYSRRAVDVGQRLCTGLQIGQTEDGELRVISVAADSPADRAGVRSGMRITHINGRPAKGIDRAFLAKVRAQPDGTTIRYGLVGAEGPFEAVLEKVFLR